MLCIAVMVRGNHLLLRERDADCTEWGEGFHLSFWGDVYWDLLRLLQLRTAVTQVLESLHVGSWANSQLLLSPHVLSHPFIWTKAFAKNECVVQEFVLFCSLLGLES